MYIPARKKLLLKEKSCYERCIRQTAKESSGHPCALLKESQLFLIRYMELRRPSSSLTHRVQYIFIKRASERASALACIYETEAHNSFCSVAKHILRPVRAHFAQQTWRRLSTCATRRVNCSWNLLHFLPRRQSFAAGVHKIRTISTGLSRVHSPSANRTQQPSQQRERRWN